MKKYQISSEHLEIHTLKAILGSKCKVGLSGDAKKRIKTCRQYLDKKIKKSDTAYYGINTGFGDFCNVVIPPKQLEQLQANLLVSHAVGLGEEVPLDIVRLMLLLKVQSLSYGHSGVTLATVLRLLEFYNSDCLPVVFQQGSLGASGDLAPLSHLCLPLIGMGDVYFQGKKIKAATALKKMGLKPLKLQSKEALSLINGTQFMSAFGVGILFKAQHLLECAELIASISLEAFDARTEPFTDCIHQVRKQIGQITTAQRIRAYLKDSEIYTRSPKRQVQDPYSFRCIPQVHGASRDAIDFAHQIFTREINAVTDNPNIFPDEDLILSGGNFHGQPLALALDYLAMALAELGNISERRMYLLLSSPGGLPPFLTEHGGLNSGLMMPQYTAAALVSQNKQLCTPASVDSIPSSNGREDHVSMGANAATKCYKVVENLEKILGIELLAAAQAMHFRKEYQTGEKVAQCLKKYASFVSFIEEDRFLQKDMLAAIGFVKEEIGAFLVDN